MPSLRFSAEALRELARRLLISSDVPHAPADLVARSLVMADQAGIFSHGLLRLPLYLRVIAAGGIDPVATPQVVRRHGAVTVLDGRAAFGQVTMDEAVDIAAPAAREHGVAVVAVQGSGHFGAGQFWVRRLAEQGAAGILTSTTGPVAAPFGGSRPIIGTNPLTIALPSAGPSPLLADLATTAGAYGKVVAARNESEEIPEGWGVDAAGDATIDPVAVLDGGALLPFGGHKGSGIAVLLEGLSAALTSAAFAYNTVDIWQDPSSRMNTGHLLIALDLAAFGEPEEIRQKVHELQEEVRSSNPTRPVVAPGDIESERLLADATTVDLAGSTVRELREVAEQRSVPFPAPTEEGSP